MRHLFDKHGGNLGQSGSVSYMFDRKGVIVIEKDDKLDEEELMMMALDAGADDFSADDECYEIITSPEAFSSVREKLEANKLNFIEAEIKYVPQNYVAVSEEVAVKLQRLIDALEDNDDVQSVWTNWEE